MLYINQKLRGFTLVELIVSVGIFSVVMVIALGALLSISAAERKAETLKSVMNNLNFSLESMSRTIRTGASYVVTGANSISFIPSTSASRTIYGFEGSDASFCGQSGTIGCIKRSTDGGTTWGAVTAPEVIITNFSVYVVGQNPSPDTTQPKVTITLSGYVQVSATQQTKFNLQTSITQRVYDQ